MLDYLLYILDIYIWLIIYTIFTHCRHCHPIIDIVFWTHMKFTIWFIFIWIIFAFLHISCLLIKESHTIKDGIPIMTSKSVVATVHGLLNISLIKSLPSAKDGLESYNYREFTLDRVLILGGDIGKSLYTDISNWSILIVFPISFMEEVSKETWINR